MSLEKITEFKSKLDEMQDPRKRRGFIDSFHAGLMQGEIYDLDQESIEKAAELERSYGFDSHANKLLDHPAYTDGISLGKLSLDEDNVYGCPSHNPKTTVDEEVGIGVSRKVKDGYVHRETDQHFKDPFLGVAAMTYFLINAFPGSSGGTSDPDPTPKDSNPTFEGESGFYNGVK